ncbi:hypothetical protein AGR1A_Cc20797 [Agrobacterium fabacearum CFBP 5771]|nr:hypothetical protein AGR1A_Cc20797 [Agrobacterium fabacearum CFBP 5771]
MRNGMAKIGMHILCCLIFEMLKYCFKFKSIDFYNLMLLKFELEVKFRNINVYFIFKSILISLLNVL